MLVHLAYGDSGLAVDLPEAVTTIVRPRHRTPAPDPARTLRSALRRPVAGASLRSVARPGQLVAISVCDVTRPQPRPVMLRAILDELHGVIRPEDVTILIASGTHRASTDDELDAMLGAEVRAACRVVTHDARNESDLWRGADLGDVPVRLNRHWVEADLRITTGFVEPHFFAGFSGGPKMVAPGLAGLETVLALHDARRIGDPRATWGICEGNPVHDGIRAVAAVVPPHFALDVLLDDEQRITRAFGGELFAMHAAARRAARQEAMVRVDGPFDMILTTNSGYPLDQNLYQSVKGISAAATIVRPGGTIICATECRDGIPDGSPYQRLLATGASPRDLLDAIVASPVTRPDQWQVQVQARVQVHAEVMVYSDRLSPEAIRSAHMTPIDDVSVTLSRLAAARPDTRLCVLPQGPQTIAYVA